MSKKPTLNKRKGWNKNLYVKDGVDFAALVDAAAAVLVEQGIELEAHTTRLAYSDSDVVVKSLELLRRIADGELAIVKVNNP